MKLSNNLSLYEVVKSSTAERLGIDNTPEFEHVESLRTISQRVFQPIRDYYGKPVYISSGYRCKELNTAIGGSSKSQHCKGQALDIDNDYRNTVSNKEVFDFIKDNLTFDQLIFEFGDNLNPSWVHVSYVTDRPNRKNVIRAVKVGGKTKYIPYE